MQSRRSRSVREGAGLACLAREPRRAIGLHGCIPLPSRQYRAGSTLLPDGPHNREHYAWSQAV